MNTKINRIFCLLAVLLPVSLSAAQNKLEDKALETMKKATQYMMDEVSVGGGFVWTYLPDFSRQWGEMEAKRTMVWNQSPGTPQMGQILLDAYHATGDEYYYEAAKKVASALIWGQLDCGGWNYVFDFAGEASLKDWYATVGKSGWRLEEFHTMTAVRQSALSSFSAYISRSMTRHSVLHLTRPSTLSSRASMPVAVGLSVILSSMIILSRDVRTTVRS